MFAALRDHDVDFVVIGGLAAYMHGATRVTWDLDVTTSVRRENLGRLAAALNRLEARVWVNEAVEPLAFAFDAKTLARSSRWNLITPHGRLDVLLAPTGARPFDELLEAATPAAIKDGFVVCLASIGDLIAMKTAAGREKDLQDVRDLSLILDARDEQFD